MTPELHASEVVPSTFHHMEELFGPSGAYFGCWCMFRRLKQKEFESCKPFERKWKMEELVGSGKVPGLILYEDGTPAGWVSIAPVEQFSGLFNSHFRKPNGVSGLWTISCFYIDPKFRGRGYMDVLLREAVDYARRNNASGLLAYPVEAAQRTDSAFMYTGKASLFRQHGFSEIENGKQVKDRKLMILDLRK